MPNFDNVKPYQQIPFQYSAHYENNGTIEHYEFLADPSNDPREAFVKALGEGFRNNINFNDIEITNDKKGKPMINISRNIKKFLKSKFKLQKYKIFLSLSDEKKYSIAYVIINKN